MVNSFEAIIMSNSIDGFINDNSDKSKFIFKSTNMEFACHTRHLNDLHMLIIQFDLVLSRCPTEAEGGRWHFLFDPLSVEPDLWEIFSSWYWILLYSGTHVLLCTHVLQCSVYICTHVLMYSCTHVLMYSCNHVLMYTCTYVNMYPCSHVFMYYWV